jgi:hypothetical protein
MATPRRAFFFLFFFLPLFPPTCNALYPFLGFFFHKESIVWVFLMPPPYRQNVHTQDSPSTFEAKAGYFTPINIYSPPFLYVFLLLLLLPCTFLLGLFFFIFFSTLLPFGYDPLKFQSWREREKKGLFGETGFFSTF